MNPLDWGVTAMFPCRPASLARKVALPAARVEMVLYACTADGSTFALGTLVLDDVRDVEPTLGHLHEAATRNLGAPAAALEPFAVPGMTPNAHAGRSVLQGRRPDGSPVVEHALLFARGARVFQATVVGNAPSDVAVTTFFAGLNLTR